MSPWTSSQPHASELRGALGVPHEAANRAVLGAQRVDDPRSDEACPPGDQDHFSDSTRRLADYPQCPHSSADRLDLALAGILPGPYEGRALLRGSPGFEGATRAPPQDGTTATFRRTRDPDLGSRGDLLDGRCAGRRNVGASRHAAAVQHHKKASALPEAAEGDPGRPRDHGARGAPPASSTATCACAARA